MIEWAEDQVEELSKLEDVVGGLRVLPLAITNVRLVESLARNNQSGGDSSERWTQKYAETARLAGWAAHDGRNRVISQKYLTEAMRSADSIGNQEFASYCQAMLGFEAVDNGEPLVALAYLEAAKLRAAKASPFQIILEQWSVQPLGMLGLHRDAINSLSKAERLWESHNPDEVPDWMYWLMRPSHTSVAPRGFIEHDPILAERLLRGGLENLSDDWPRDKFLFQIGIAESLLLQDKQDQLTSIVGEVIDNGGLEVVRVAERVRSLVGVLPVDKSLHDLTAKIGDTPEQ